MANKLELITKMFDEEMSSVTSSQQHWTRFLASASNGTEAMIKMSIIILAIFGILSFVYKFVIHSSIVVLG